MTQHQKHTNLRQGIMGNFGRQELAILGTTCEEVDQLVGYLAEVYGRRYRLGFVDADHEAINGKSKPPIFPGLTSGLVNHQCWETSLTMPSNAYERKIWGVPLDLVFINGNHEAGRQQIVVLNKNKINSLRKRWSALTDLQAILEPEELSPELLTIKTELLQLFPRAEVLKLNEREVWSHWFSKWMSEKTPALNGLVLAGGKSLRMGQDKGLMNYHGQPQREYLYRVLATLTDQTYVSGRPDQAGQITELAFMPDEFLGLGPYGALLTAFKNHPARAWLVVAVDMPNVNSTVLEYLIGHRDPATIATAFKSPVDSFPDPVLAIWEPKSYHRLLQFLSLGISCPRKVLINSEINLVDCPDPRWLTNINTQEEYQNYQENKMR